MYYVMYNLYVFHETIMKKIKKLEIIKILVDEGVAKNFLTKKVFFK